MCTNIKNQPMLKINDMIPHLKNKNIQFKECNEKDAELFLKETLCPRLLGVYSQNRLF